MPNAAKWPAAAGTKRINSCDLVDTGIRGFDSLPPLYSNLAFIPFLSSISEITKPAIMSKAE